MRSRSRREVSLAELAEPIGHYSHAVLFGSLLFVSGCVGTDADGSIRGGAVDQAGRALQNMADIISTVRADFRDVLKVTIYLVRVEDRLAIDPVRQEYFGDYRPASTLVEVSRLARPSAVVEIDAIVGVPMARSLPSLVARTSRGLIRSRLDR